MELLIFQLFTLYCVQPFCQTAEGRNFIPELWPVLLGLVNRLFLLHPVVSAWGTEGFWPSME